MSTTSPTRVNTISIESQPVEARQKHQGLTSVLNNLRRYKGCLVVPEELHRFYEQTLTEKEWQEHIEGFLKRVLCGTSAEELHRCIWVSHRSANHSSEAYAGFLTQWNALHQDLERTTARDGVIVCVVNATSPHIESLCDRGSWKPRAFRKYKGSAQESMRKLLEVMIADAWKLRLSSWSSVQTISGPLFRLVNPPKISSASSRKQNAHLALQWLRPLEAYDGDLSTYFARPESRRPEVGGIVIVFKRIDNRSCLLAVLASDGAAAAAVKNAYADREVFHINTNVTDQVTAFLDCLASRLAFTYNEQIERLRLELFRLNGLIRKKPSVSKAAHLIYLHDYVSCLSETALHNVSSIEFVYDTLRKRTDQDATQGQLEVEEAHQTIQDVQEDLQRASEDGQTLMSEIERLQKLNLEMLDLRDRRASSVIQLLVVLIAPFALATAVFGMNITKDNAVTTYWTNTTSTDPSANSAVMTTTDQPTGLTWPMSEFLSVAFALTIGAVIVPLVAGPLARWFVGHVLLRGQRLGMFIWCVTQSVYLSVALKTDFFQWLGLGGAGSCLGLIVSFIGTVLTMIAINEGTMRRIRWPICLAISTALCIACIICYKLGAISLDNSTEGAAYFLGLTLAGDSVDRATLEANALRGRRLTIAAKVLLSAAATAFCAPFISFMS